MTEKTMKHFITIADHSTDEIQQVLDTAFDLRQQREHGVANDPVLAGKTLAMLFEKPSLRTRVSFEQAMLELGGNAIVLAGSEVGIGKRESPADVARVLDGMVQGIMARVFEHAKLLELAAHSRVPVVNALSDHSHPCQALADVMTVIDAFGRDVTGRTIAFIGDGNNVARSLAIICGKLGMNFTIASPKGYELEQELLDDIATQAPNLKLNAGHDPVAAVKEADAIYTDTFVSMGQEAEKQKRLADFADFQLNSKLIGEAPEHAIVLHCLPAYRGIEITDDIMDGPQSRVFPQAHNRLHAQKGLLAELMG